MGAGGNQDRNARPFEEGTVMSGMDEGGTGAGGNFYGPQYARIDSELAAEIRREAFGEDIGQESWRSAAEQTEIATLLGLGVDSRVLDVACGAGGAVARADRAHRLPVDRPRHRT
jgi:hypothetical protein